MVIGALIFGLILCGLVALRRRRKAMLAGLNSERPAFSIEPPARRHNKRKHEAL